jgi:hypothetical protein
MWQRGELCEAAHPIVGDSEVGQLGLLAQVWYVDAVPS